MRAGGGVSVKYTSALANALVATSRWAIKVCAWVSHTMVVGSWFMAYTHRQADHKDRGAWCGATHARRIKRVGRSGRCLMLQYHRHSTAAYEEEQHTMLRGGSATTKFAGQKVNIIFLKCRVRVLTHPGRPAKCWCGSQLVLTTSSRPLLLPVPGGERAQGCLWRRRYFSFSLSSASACSKLGCAAIAPAAVVVNAPHAVAKYTALFSDAASPAATPGSSSSLCTNPAK